MSGEPFVARVLRWKALAGIAIAAAILAYLLFTPAYGVSVGISGPAGLVAGILDALGFHIPRPVMLALGVAILALVLIAFVWRFFAGGVRVRVDEVGILDRDFFDAPIRWEEIEQAWVQAARNDADRELYLKLRAGVRRRAKLPMRLVWPFEGHQKRREVRVTMQGLDGDFDMLLDAVEQFCPGLLSREG